MTYPHGPNDRGRGPDPRDQRGSYPDSRDQRGAPDPRDEDENELFPEGDYPVVAVAHKLGYSGNKNPQVGVRLKITDGPHKGKGLLWYGTFTDKSEEITIKALRALGMRGDDIAKNINSIYDNDSKAIAVVEHEKYEGKLRAKVKWINGADVTMKDEMDGSELAAFSQRMRGAFARYGGGGAAPAPSTQSRSSAPPPRDDRGGGRDQRGRDPRDVPPPSDNDEPWNERPSGRR